MKTETPIHPRDGRLLVHAETQEGWRAWLAENHDASGGVWLVSWKKATGRPLVHQSEAVDEALCFGWVDSKVNKLDEERAMLLFTPRNPKSTWSRINKEKVARLIEEGRMTPAGTRLIEAAKSNGSWTIYDEIEGLVIPPDLADALAGDEAAAGFFEYFPDSSKKNMLWWIKSAKKPSTRADRVEKLVRLAAHNRMANHPVGRDKGPERTQLKGAEGRS